MTEIANTDCFEAWNGDSGRRWANDAERRDRVLAPVADALVHAARLAPEDQVLDIGCGCGATTLRAARTVGPEGGASGIDLSAPMLDVARGRAEAEGLENLTFVQGDAQTYRFAPAFDVAISRFGTMFFADQVAAMVNLASGFRGRGRVCFATWQSLEANE